MGTATAVMVATPNLSAPPDSIEANMAAPPGMPFKAEISLANLAQDSESRSIRGDVTVTLGSRVEGIDVRDVALSLVEPPDEPGRAGRRQWLLLEDQERCAPASGQADENHGIVYYCRNMALWDTNAFEEVRYPFDSYSTRISPKLCVNRHAVCGTSSDVEVLRIRLVVADRRLVGSISSPPTAEGEFEFTLQRSRFVRGTAVLLFLLALGVLAHTMAHAMPTDVVTNAAAFAFALSMLRTLLVPPTVFAFPTLVDYAVLGLLCILLTLVLIKVKQHAPE